MAKRTTKKVPIPPRSRKQPPEAPNPTDVHVLTALGEVIELSAENVEILSRGLILSNDQDIIAEFVAGQFVGWWRVNAMIKPGKRDPSHSC